ncbi:Hypothetical predicted protein [Olea europaea subsp. europaea]|uniref:Uncharacterized protein n=1 Tax=Olea europaea subsp. europaea TaxID=158383 RepID=A0A8S0U3E9_OLEEU|nr:Hypothetical predicted protein [Olea europaea subsp. europaea]
MESAMLNNLKDRSIVLQGIRNGTNGVRSLTGSKHFAQSMQTTKRKSQLSQLLSAKTSGNGNLPVSNNGSIVESGYHVNTSSASEREEDKYQSSARLINFDIHKSSCYDMILFKDVQNAN